MKALFHTIPAPGMAEQIRKASPDWLKLVMVAEEDLEGFKREAKDSDAIFHVLKPITAKMISYAPDLKLIQKIGVGVNTIDLVAAEAVGVKVANMPGTNSRAVAELTLGLMLAATRRMVTLDQATRAGQGWTVDKEFYDHVGEIGGKTVGLVGYGSIPQLLAPVLQALGADVVYTARTPREGAIGRYLPFDELLSCADILSLHIPLTTETAGVLGADAFSRMKDGVIIVNTARGELIDEAALLEALRMGKVRAAGLDVFSVEPVLKDNPLLRSENVVLAPHAAWLTPETIERSVSIAFENCRRIRDGEDLLHRVI